MTSPEPTSCETAREWIEDAVRGKLDEPASVHLAAHVATCSACREAESDARRVRAALRDVAMPRCPEHVVARIHAAVDADGALRATGRAAPSVLERIAAWLAGATWRPVVVTAAALLLVVLLGDRRLEAPVPGAAAPRGAAQSGVFCEEDIDALLATMDLGDIGEEEARRAAEEACLAFAILARAMNRAAGVAETELIESLEVPVRRGVGSGMDHLPAPLHPSERAPLDRRG